MDINGQAPFEAVSKGCFLERFGDMLFVVEAKGRKKRTVFAALAVLAMGVAPLVNSLGNPRLAGLHGADMVQLAAIGFCVGLSLGMFLVGRASSITFRVCPQHSCHRSRNGQGTSCRPTTPTSPFPYC
jgi:hypothetical protein